MLVAKHQRKKQLRKNPQLKRKLLQKRSEVIMPGTMMKKDKKGSYGHGGSTPSLKKNKHQTYMGGGVMKKKAPMSAMFRGGKTGK